MGDGNKFRRGRRRSTRGKRSGGAAKRGAPFGGQPGRRLLSLEPLEDRRMLATFMVTNLLDDEPGSLRAAVDNANADDDPDTILFADGLFGVIALTEGQLNITQPVRIVSPNPNLLAVQASANSRIFNVDIGDDDDFSPVEISGLTLMRGNVVTGDADNRLGGAIWNRENLTLRETIITDNHADNGGGGIYHEFGFLRMDRCLVGTYYNILFGLDPTLGLVLGNTTGPRGGAGVLIGDDEGDEDNDNLAQASIANSTFTGNFVQAFGPEGGYGGAIFNRRGRATITGNTIISNQGNGAGGVASWGNLPPEPPDEEGGEPGETPDRTVFTTIISNIIYGNGTDVAEVGGPVEFDDVEVEREPSVDTINFNDIGMYADNVEPGEDDISEDPMLSEGLFGAPTDFGGKMPVFYPLPGSPVIDAGSTSLGFSDGLDQRGLYFLRVAGDGPDIGAVEVQSATFVVDILHDESDQVYSGIVAEGATFTNPYQRGIPNIILGDLSLREAILFSELNPEVDTISFIDFRGDLFNPDFTVSPAPTVLLKNSLFKLQLSIASSVNIVGPTTWVLEIDASGNDPSPLVNNADGTRVFNIDNGVSSIQSDIVMSDLAILGGDTVGSGGGIFSRENLTLNRVSVRDNSASSRGGGVYIQHANLTIDGAAFTGNRAADDGGGLYIDTGVIDPTVDITSSTFSGNTASDRGAGIQNNAGDLSIRHSTITLNTAGSTFGGGIVNSGANSTTTIYSSIVSNNSNNRNVEVYSGAVAASFTSEGFNYVGGGNAASRFNQTGDISGTNPMIAPLSNTGGLTLTHRPLPGSPIIDIGQTNPPNAPMFDQRGQGFVRIFDGNSDGTARIDIGAYELQPTELVVDSAQDTSDGDYSLGMFTLREAVEISNQNPLIDTIRFAPTLSVIFVGGSLAPTITITDSVNIIGPGAQDLALQALQVLPTQLVLADRILTIDNSLASLLDVNISGLEFRNAQVGALFSRENLTLKEVTFVNNRSNVPGGAVSHQTGNFSITDSVITGNSTTAVGADGGAMYFTNVNGGAKVVFQDTSVSGNSTTAASADGGAIYLKNTVAEFHASSVSGNSTIAGTADGGGLFVDNSTVLFEESTISGNTTVGANSEGAGLAILGPASVVTLTKSTALNVNSTIGTNSHGAGAFVFSGALNIENSVIDGNTTSGQNASGGAIALSGGSVKIVGTAVQQNRVNASGSHGGALANMGGTLLVRDSTVSANVAAHAASNGGGIHSDTDLAGQLTTILNSTVSGNSAGNRGGGVFNADGRTEIHHSTVTNNSVSFFNSGGGVGSFGNGATQTVVSSSIIAGNVGAAAGTKSDLDSVDGAFTNSFQSLGYNVVGTGNSIGAFVQVGDKNGITNTLLGPLAANGGLVDTHALLDGSPAVNSGNPAFNASAFSPALNNDERGAGFARVKGGRIDTGAFESSFSPFTADFNLDGRVDGNDFVLWQRNLGINVGATRMQGDANGDGAVSAADLAQWKLQFGASSSEAAAAPASATGGAQTPAVALAVSEASPAASTTGAADDAEQPAPATASLLRSGAPRARRSEPKSAATGNFQALAGIGLSTARIAHRSHAPMAERAAHARRALRMAAFAAWSDRTGEDDRPWSARRRNSATFADAAPSESDAPAGEEDAVFAQLGDNAL